ncbi:MAG: HAD-IIB family hydrolase [Clostridia bacterium]|nr:HAD-IIB family hydrolase [Clostridia bacterium]
MKKFENIYIASDIDGTFLWDCAYVNPKNISAVKYFTENGGHFAFSTGRNRFDTERVLPVWRELCNMPCIFCNGSMLYDPKTDETIDPIYIEPAEKAAEVFRFIRDKFADVAGARATTPRGFLFADDDEYVLSRFTENGNIHVSEVLPIEKIDGSELFKIVVETTPEYREKIFEAMAAHFGDVFELTYSAPMLVEVQPRGVSKASAIDAMRKRARKLNPDAKFYCIGDYNNDYKMLLAADVAVCPANACESIKAVADIEVCHCECGALADLIEKIENSLE